MTSIVKSSSSARVFSERILLSQPRLPLARYWRIAPASAAFAIAAVPTASANASRPPISYRTIFTENKQQWSHNLKRHPQPCLHEFSKREDH
uniref:Uncharacterized protein n=1 Tax=Trichuris muris TaxID=70415 RepID=A0A5S6QYG7_TRIMR